jgi:hypothetical protein
MIELFFPPEIFGFEFVARLNYSTRVYFFRFVVLLAAADFREGGMEVSFMFALYIKTLEEQSIKIGMEPEDFLLSKMVLDFNGLN